MNIIDKIFDRLGYVNKNRLVTLSRERLISSDNTNHEAKMYKHVCVGELCSDISKKIKVTEETITHPYYPNTIKHTASITILNEDTIQQSS